MTEQNRYESLYDSATRKFIADVKAKRRSAIQYWKRTFVWLDKELKELGED